MDTPRALILAIAVALCCVLIGLAAPIASAEPPPPPPSVSLSAEHTTVKVSETIHLTATAASDVGPTPYTIRLFDADAHTQIASCGSGITCTASVNVEWAENEHPTTHHYYAEVNGGSEGLYTRSGEVAISVEPYVFSVSLTATPSTVTIPESYTLKATSSRDVGPTPYYIRIIENGTNSQVAQCGSGTECSTTVASSWSENGEVHSHGYHAVVANNTYTAGTSGNASVAVLPFFFTVSLTLTYDHSEEREGHLVEWDKAVAKTDRDVGPTPYWLAIRKDGSLETRCGSGTECSAIVEAGHTYTADVENGEGRSFGGSVISSVNVASLAGLFGGASTICTALLTDPYQTHYAGSSVGDQELACEAAIGRGATAAGVISAVAATTGGTAALWWLLHEGTVTQPGYEAPKPSEADPYPVPTTLPETWPVKEIVAEVEAKNPASELTKEQIEEVTKRCLWYAPQGDMAGSDCASVPVFIWGEDIAAAARHDLKALAGHPAWIQLNYEKASVKEANGEFHSWYNSVGGCPGEQPMGTQCDEYPLFSTEQGGPGKPIQPSLEWVNGPENELQGTRYSTFLGACEVTEHRAFIGLPLPAGSGIPSAPLCNKG